MWSIEFNGSCYVPFCSIQSNENIIYDFYKVWCNCYPIICVELLFYAVHDNWRHLRVSKISVRDRISKKINQANDRPWFTTQLTENGFFFFFSYMFYRNKVIKMYKNNVLCHISPAFFFRLFHLFLLLLSVFNRIFC